MFNHIKMPPYHQTSSFGQNSCEWSIKIWKQLPLLPDCRSNRMWFPPWSLAICQSGLAYWRVLLIMVTTYRSSYSSPLKQQSSFLTNSEKHSFAHKINHMYSKWWLHATVDPVQTPAQKTANWICPTVFGCLPGSAPSLAYLSLVTNMNYNWIICIYWKHVKI